MKTSTRLIIGIIVGLAAMFIVGGGIHLVRLTGNDTIVTLSGWYMVVDGIATFIGSAIYSFRTTWSVQEEDTDDEYEDDFEEVS